jgi:hypothetical protein
VKLTIAGNWIGLEGAMHVDCMCFCRPSVILSASLRSAELTELNLGCNELGSLGAMAISNLLQSSSRLVELDLSSLPSWHIFSLDEAIECVKKAQP